MPKRTDDLSEKQKECLRFVHQGLTSKEIAAQLDLTPGTVDNYVNAALGKLAVTSRRKAARLLALEEAGQRLPEKEIVQRLYLQSASLAPSAGDEEQTGQAADEQDRLARLPVLPPVGGADNDLTAPQRIMAISRVGFAAALTLIAAVVIVQGVITLLT